MTRVFALTALFSLTAIACNSAISVAADESVEPPLIYSVKVGEKTVTVSEGETVQFDGTFTNPKVTVTPQSHRLFSCQGLAFEYPRSFTFEADLEDSDTKCWTLSGNDFKIMYFVLNASLTASEFADNMVEQFGPMNAEIVNPNASIFLGKQKLSGTSLRITVATHQMVMDIYRIPSRGAKTKLLVFQDSPDASGNRSDEGRKTLADIKSSFEAEQ